MPPEKRVVTQLLGASTINQAIEELLLRAERQEHVQLLVATFVEPGAIGRDLNNDNNQVLVGRRGTGKTHILRVLGTRRRGLPVYMDMRQVAQTPRVGDEQLPAPVRVASIFQILMRGIHDRLATHLKTLTGEKKRLATEALQEFTRAISDVSRENEITFQERQNTDGYTRDNSIRVGLVGPHPSVGAASGESETASVAETEAVGGGRTTARVLFADVDRTLLALLERSEITRLLVIVDEWTAIPYELQPLFADYLNRALFNNPRVTVKIATVAYRSQFESPGPRNTRVGLEAGDDFSFVELDVQFVYKRHPDRVAKFFAELLWRHVSVDAAIADWQKGFAAKRGPLFGVLSRSSPTPDEQESKVLDELTKLFRQVGQEFMDKPATEYMTREFDVDGPEALVKAMFTGQGGREGTFHELVHASQGVIRDFIYILAKAYSAAVDSGARKIDKRTVADAAEEWHSRDKRSKASSLQDTVFGRILDYVLKHGDSDLFLLKGELERHEVVEALYDLRLIHLIQRGYRLADSPTVSYNQYALDYGTYKQLIKHRPKNQRAARTIDAQAQHETQAPNHGVVVPADLITDPMGV